MLHFLELYFALGIGFILLKNLIQKLKKIKAKNLTCTVSVKVRLSTVVFKKKTLQFTVNNHNFNYT